MKNEMGRLRMRRIGRSLRYDWPLHVVLFMTAWLPDNVVFLRLRGWLAHWFLGSCGRDLRLGRGIVFYNPRNISIGHHVYVAYGTWFSAGAEIRLGNEVLVGPYCVFASSNHTRLNGSFRYGPARQAPISVETGVWIAAQATITAGSTIGEGSLVAAGSVVQSQIPSGSLAAGQPARVVREERDW